jgi:hypothetical protein
MKIQTPRMAPLGARTYEEPEKASPGEPKIHGYTGEYHLEVQQDIA